MKTILFKLTISLVALYVLSAASTAYSSCLDSYPQNPQEIQRKIRTLKMQIQLAKGSEAAYLQIALDATKTSSRSKLVGGISSALVIAGIGADFISAYGLGFITHNGEFSARALQMVSLALNLGSGYAYFLKMDIPKDRIDEIKNQISKSQETETCSYQRTYELLDSTAQNVFDNELNGSFINNVKDHITFGNLSAVATQKLYAVAVLKRLTLENELKSIEEASHYILSGVGMPINESPFVRTSPAQ